MAGVFAMTESERMTIDSGARCDGQCDVRLLRKLQEAIGDILSDRARESTAERTPINAAARPEGFAPATEVGAMTVNGYDLASQPATAAPAHGGGAAWSPAQTAKTVVDTIAEMTRYPREILTPQARFDEDLGIDSLKRAEIVTALLNRFGEVPSDLKALGPIPLTIGEMTDFAVAYVGRSGGPAAKSQPAAGARDADAVMLRYPERSADVAASPQAGAASRKAADRPFEGKVALITGSGDGLGKAIAKQMAELGAHVIINAFPSREQGEETSREILAESGQATHVWGSFASTDHIERAFREIEERFARLDYYVHNAADEVIASLDKVTESHWEKAFRTNIVGYHLCAMRAAKLMQKSGGGRIVALSSPGAQRYVEYYGVMGPVKAALESLTMYLAQELGPCNVQVNAVAACPIYGEQLSSFPDSDMMIPYWESRVRGGRLGNPEEISDAVIFLLTKAARKINGSTMVVDGGWSQRI